MKSLSYIVENEKKVKKSNKKGERESKEEREMKMTWRVKRVTINAVQLEVAQSVSRKWKRAKREIGCVGIKTGLIFNGVCMSYKRVGRRGGHEMCSFERSPKRHLRPLTGWQQAELRWGDFGVHTRACIRRASSSKSVTQLRADSCRLFVNFPKRLD